MRKRIKRWIENWRRFRMVLAVRRARRHLDALGCKGSYVIEIEPNITTVRELAADHTCSSPRFCFR